MDESRQKYEANIEAELKEICQEFEVKIEAELEAVQRQVDRAPRDQRTNKFNFAELEEEFRKGCEDYGLPLEDGVPSKSLDFALTVIFKVTRQAKEDRSKDFRWTFDFKDKNDKLWVVHVCTFRKANIDRFETPKFKDNQMIISLKQATLLAMNAIRMLVDLKDETDIMLVPLVEAAMCKSELAGLAEELGLAPKELAKRLNESAISNGHYLPLSDFSIALAFANDSTRYMENKIQRERILDDVIKKYKRANKVFDRVTFIAVSKRLNGGVPLGMELKFLEAVMQEAKENRFKILQEKAIDAQRPLSTTTSAGMLSDIGSKESNAQSNRDEGQREVDEAPEVEGAMALLNI